MSRRRAEGETCPRCGTFATLSWHGRRRKLCDDCIERARHPIERSPAKTGEILRGVGTLLRQDGLRLAATAALIQLPIAILTLVADLPPIARAFYAFATLLGTGAAIEVALQRIDGGELSIVSAYRLAVRKWIGMIAANLFAGLIIMFLMVLLVVPGILRALSYAIVLPLIIDGEAHGVDALSLSRERMKGHRLAVLPVYLVTLLPWIIVAVLYMFVSTALSGAETGAILMGEPLPAYPPSLRAVDAADALLYPVWDLPAVLTAVVLHVKLRRPSKA